MVEPDKIALHLAINIKQQIAHISDANYPMYSHRLYKTLNVYLRYIRLFAPKHKPILKIILLDLFDMKRLIAQKMLFYSNYDSLENIKDILVASIISVVNVQHKLGYIKRTQYHNYIQTALK